jgi:hypothetical protein
LNAIDANANSRAMKPRNLKKAFMYRQRDLLVSLVSPLLLLLSPEIVA